jgi:hypothetical protein
MKFAAPPGKYEAIFDNLALRGKMSLFNLKFGEGAGRPLEQWQDIATRLDRTLTAERLAHAKTREERDELLLQKAEHQRDYPDCMKYKPAGPTCPGCGIFYIPGPQPCQGCGYSE